MKKGVPREKAQELIDAMPEDLRIRKGKNRQTIERAILSFVTSDLKASGAPVKVVPLDDKILERAKSDLSCE